MNFTIVTPSYNCFDFLPQCCASVADQRKDVSVEHIVIDGASRDGTPEWLSRGEKQYAFSWVSEPDAGMYDALNKGFARASGDYFAWLNGDEQYLPGVLAKVKAFFESNPGCDMLCGNSLVVNKENKLLCVRKAEPLRIPYIVVEGMRLLTCSVFFRRDFWDRGIRFDASLKSVGENDYFLRVLQDGGRVGYASFYTAAFTNTGGNLGTSDLAKSEFLAFRKKHKKWYSERFLSQGVLLLRYLEKLLRGAYCVPDKIEYALYSGECLVSRNNYICNNPTYKWSEHDTYI